MRGEQRWVGHGFHGFYALLFPKLAIKLLGSTHMQQLYSNLFFVVAV